MDGAESGDQLLFFDGAIEGGWMVRDVGRDAEVIDFGGGKIRGVGGGFIAAGGDAAGAIPSAALGGIIAL
jgi:hypothetical protein